jgi:hypothetical protein
MTLPLQIARALVNSASALNAVAVETKPQKTAADLPTDTTLPEIAPA